MSDTKKFTMIDEEFTCIVCNNKVKPLSVENLKEIRWQMMMILKRY